jgi:hypothetical protein
MRPETQDLIHEISSFADNKSWSIALAVYNDDMTDNEDFWKSISKDFALKIFIFTITETHRIDSARMLTHEGNKEPVLIDHLLEALSAGRYVLKSKGGKMILNYMMKIREELHHTDLEELLDTLSYYQEPDLEEAILLIGRTIRQKLFPPEE